MFPLLQPSLPKLRRTLPHLAAAMASLLLGTAHAQSNIEEEVDDGNKAWKEMAVQLPSPPIAENLIPFYVSPTATQSFAIDAKSLSVGADDVVRYTLVATSTAGATNISYEGIRCQSMQRKLYAFGHPDGSWSRSRHDQWEPISANAANRQHAALATEFLCEGSTVAGRVEDIIRRMRLGKTIIDR